MNKLHSSVKNHIEAVKGKLIAENVSFNNYDKAIKCLNECVAPDLAINIYKKYINKKEINDTKRT